MRYILALLLLTSCFGGGEQLLVQRSSLPSAKKQRQKLALLQKKLEIAEREKEKALNDVEKLAQAIDEAKLMLIRRQIDDYERKKERSATLFMEEREALYLLMRSGPSSRSFEAQVELDRILRIITELSDDEKFIY